MSLPQEVEKPLRPTDTHLSPFALVSCTVDASNTRDRRRSGYRERRRATSAGNDGTADKVKGKPKDAEGQAREKLGDATDDEEMKARGQDQQVEGKATELKGEAKDKIGDLKKKLSSSALSFTASQAVGSGRKRGLPDLRSVAVRPVRYGSSWLCAGTLLAVDALATPATEKRG